MLRRSDGGECGGDNGGGGDCRFSFGSLLVKSEQCQW